MLKYLSLAQIPRRWFSLTQVVGLKRSNEFLFISKDTIYLYLVTEKVEGNVITVSEPLNIARCRIAYFLLLRLSMKANM